MACWLPGCISTKLGKKRSSRHSTWDAGVPSGGLTSCAPMLTLPTYLRVANHGGEGQGTWLRADLPLAGSPSAPFTSGSLCPDGTQRGDLPHVSVAAAPPTASHQASLGLSFLICTQPAAPTLPKPRLSRSTAEELLCKAEVLESLACVALQLPSCRRLPEATRLRPAQGQPASCSRTLTRVWAQLLTHTHPLADSGPPWVPAGCQHHGALVFLPRPGPGPAPSCFLSLWRFPQPQPTHRAQCGFFLHSPPLLVQALYPS